MKKLNPIWVLVAVLLIAVVLRPPVAQIGPILDLIESSLGLSGSQTALLAAVPVLCFGFGAFAAPSLVRKFGLNHTMVYLIGLILVAIAIRPFLGFWLLLIGTMIAGLAIAVANVLLPTIVRERFPSKVALLTSAYTTILAASASFAAAFAYPTANLVGWQLALALWALPALLAFMFSFALVRGSEASQVALSAAHEGDFKRIANSPIAWSIIGLFGIQSMGFYALLAWLPNLAMDSGMDPNEAGSLVSLMTIVGVPIGLVLSSNFGKFKQLSTIGSMVSLLTAVGLVLLLLKLWLPAVIVIGIGQASSFPLSLNLISTRAANQQLTTMLSSISQGIGYLVAACGTFFFGWLAKETGNWNVSVSGLIAFTLVQVVAAWYAGRNKVIR